MTMSFLLRSTAAAARLTPLSVAATRNFTTSRILSIKVDSHFISQITAAEKILTNSDEPVKGGPTAQAQSHVGQELTAQVVHDITAGEKVITNSDQPVKGGPTSVAQSALTSSSSSSPSNVNTNTTNNNTSSSGVIDSTTLHDITEAEKQITGRDGPVRRGPTATAQKHVGEPLTSAVLDEINRAQQSLAGNPTSSASSPNNNTTNNASTLAQGQGQQQHTGHIDSSTLSSITAAEKQLTGSDGPVPDGPTARAQQHANEPITSQVLHDITEGEKVVTGGERVKGGPTSKAQSELGKSRSGN